MDEFYCKATMRTPEVRLSPDKAQLCISGESYPENVTAFFKDVHEALDVFFAHKPARFDVHFALSYFNSGSAHAILGMIGKLNERAIKGCHIVIEWVYHGEDDISYAFAQDIATHAPQLTVQVKKSES